MAEVTGNAKVTLDGSDASAKLKKLEAEAADLRKSLIELHKAELVDNKKVKETELALKAVNKEIKSVKNSTVSYAQTLKNLSGASIRELETAARLLRIEMKGLSRNTEEYKQKLKELAAVKSELAKIGNEMKAAGVETKSFGDRLKNIGANMFAATGIIGGFTALYSVVSKAFTTIKEFASGISELKAITGASGDDLEYLKQKAKEMSSQYGTSAREVVGAMKMVGSAKPELLSNVQALGEVTEAVLTLSKASGMDLQTTTASLTTIMNQFGHAASEANKDINILAAGSKYGAVEVDYLSEAMVKVGTVASSAGLSLEKTTAVMELFGEKGVRAEIAGTGFKSVLVELQKDTKNYTNGVFDLNKAIDRNQSISTDNIALQEKFGKEFFNLAGILLQNKDRFLELEKQITGTNVAFEQAAIQMDNLQGDLNKAAAGWDRFILTLEDGDGILSKAARGLTGIFTGFLEDLTTANDSSATFAERIMGWIDVLARANPAFALLNERIKDLFNVDEKFADLKFQRDLKDAKERGIAAAHAEIEARKNKAKEADEIEKELTEKEAKEWEKRKEQALKATEDLNNQIRQWNIEMINDEQLRKEAELNLWYEKEQEKINISKAAAEQRNEALLVLDQVYLDKLSDLYQNNFDDYLKKRQESDQAVEEEMLNQAEIDAEQFKSQDETKETYAQKDVKRAKDTENKKFKEADKKLKDTQQVIGYFYDFLDSQRQAELTAAGDNEEKKKEIMKKYADKEFLLKASQIIAATARAVMEAFALGPIAGPIAAAIIGATGLAQLNLANKERKRVKGLEKGGKFGVTRAQDGKKFSAGYGGNGTGYYSEPTVLVAEDGPEFVVSNRALRVPEFKRAVDAIDSYQRGQSFRNLNYNGLISRLNQPIGLAEGGFTPTPQAVTAQQSTDGIIAAINQMRLEISQWQRELEVYVEITKIRDAEASLSSIETKVKL